MRRFLTAFAAAVLMLSLGTADAAEYKKMTIRAATANPQGSLHVVAIDKFKEIVEKESNGAITVQTFYGGSLGDEQANVKQLRNAEIASRGAGGREPDALRAAGRGVYPAVHVPEDFRRRKAVRQ